MDTDSPFAVFVIERIGLLAPLAATKTADWLAQNDFLWRLARMLPLPLPALFDPGLTELNRLPARAPLSPAPNAAALASEERKWRKSLDGTWHFLLAPHPEATPQAWQSDDVSGWRTIHVPGVWTRQDTGDLPIYSNFRMPFAAPTEPGEVPGDNPTGLYRTSFRVDADWTGRDIILHIGGFESMALVWLNGQFVGMGKDSRLPSEFDLTQHLADGANEVAIMVIKWSDATWIEDQDHWRHGGIHRSVYLEARAKTRLDDIQIAADFDPESGTGKLSATAIIRGSSNGWAVRGQLIDSAGSLVTDLPARSVDQFDASAPVISQLMSSYIYPGHHAVLEISIASVHPWSAEAPNRYRLVLELIDASGAVHEAIDQWVGFRRVEVRDRRLLINGKPIVIIGVNRHDHHSVNGKTCSLEDMRADLVLMKQHNVNGLRTAHYPNDHRLLDLADELGLYVVDEANIECHARAIAVSNDMRYQKAIIDRVHRMILRDRNHACIIGWSLGNESGHGPAHDAAAALARRLDPTRFVQYEGALMKRFATFWGNLSNDSQQRPSPSERTTTDIVCPMYPPIDFIVDWARWAEKTKLDDRPLIMCEYSHAMGNSNGSIAEYVDAFFAEPALGGGFIWEWRDHGLAEIAANGRPYWAYGGHFGEELHDANFCCDGLVASDGVPNAGLREYKWAARPIQASLTDDGRIAVYSRRAFSDSTDLELHWSIQRNGETIEAGVLDIALAAGERATVSNPSKTSLSGDGEFHLTLDWRIKTATGWAIAGHSVGVDQLLLKASGKSFNTAAIPAPVGAVEAGEIALGNAVVSIDTDGHIAGVSLAGKQAISADITACLWRAPVDNDGVRSMADQGLANVRQSWIMHGLDNLNLVRSASAMLDGALILEREWEGTNGVRAIHRSRISGSHQGLVFDEEILIPDEWSDMPRIGVRFEVPAGLEHLTWHGLGPDESYPDRKGAQTVGLWRSSIDDQYVPYAFPQEHGSHQDTRSFSLTDENGQGMQIALSRPLSFAARHQHDANIDDADTLADVERRDSIEVHIDAGMRGVGTGAVGPDALPQYRHGPGRYVFSWTLKPAA